MAPRNLRRSSDEKLVRAARGGDVRAFEELYRRHQPAILSFCRHLTGRLEDAEDAVQHTFLSAHFAITGDDAELDLKPWLFTVARNRCISLLRSRRVREPRPALRTASHPLPAVEEAPADAWGVDGLAEEVERREDLRELVRDLGELPEPQRAALVLSELEALSHAQIAQVLDVAPAKVRALVFQARSSLFSTREARDTPCGEIRIQISTLRGSSLRRRTLRRHVRACSGCREFEAAVRVQRRDLALILPVVAITTSRDALPGAVANAVASSASNGGASGAAAGGGAAAAGAGAAAGGGAATTGGGLLTGILTAVAGGGAVQLTAVVAVAAAGTVGAVKTDLPDRLGMTGPIGAEHAEVRQAGDHRAVSGSTNFAATDRSGKAAGDFGGRAGNGDGDGGAAGEHSGSPTQRSAGSPAGGSGAKTDVAPGRARSDGRSPPGLARGDGRVPPGLAKKDGDPPGRERGPGGGKRGGNGGGGDGRGNGGGQPEHAPGRSRPSQPGSRAPTGTPPGHSRGSEPGSQATKSPPPGQSNGMPPGRANGAPPGQARKEDGATPSPSSHAGNQDGQSSQAPAPPLAAGTPGKPEKPAKPK